MIKNLDLTQTELRIINEALKSYATQHVDKSANCVPASLVGMRICILCEDMTVEQLKQDIHETTTRSLEAVKLSAQKLKDDVAAGHPAALEAVAAMEAADINPNLVDMLANVDADPAPRKTKQEMKVQFPDSMGGFA
jgi:hypothetical protein